MSAQRALAMEPEPAGQLAIAAATQEKAADAAAEGGDNAAEVGGTQGVEAITPAEPATNPSILAPALDQAAREQVLARIRQSAVLPPALGERLAALVESSSEMTVGGEPRVLLAACLEALEASLPEFLGESRAEAAKSTHPAGEAFFRGNSTELSDQQAESLAQRQLVRSGLLRGQRVRVAD